MTENVVNLMEEETSFMEEHGTKLITAAVGLASGTAGYIIGKLRAESNHKKQLESIRTAIEVVLAGERGEEEITLNGETFKTEGHTVDSIKELQVYIMNEILKATKMNKKVKSQFRETLCRLAELAGEINQKEIVSNYTIVDER